MAQRTDIHRPSAPDLDPQEYELVTVYDLGWDPSIETAIAAALRDSVRHTILLNLLQNGAEWSEHRNANSAKCGHCGTRIRYAALLLHQPTSQLIEVGEVCLNNRFSLSKGQFDTLRKAAAQRRANSKLAEQRKAIIEANPVIGTIPAHLEEFRNDFLADIYRKFKRYGSLSERQIAAVQGSMKRDVEWAARRKQDVAEAALAPDVPEGKQAIKGEVVSIKWHDHAFGSTMKMVVKVEQGWAVWGSVPEAIAIEVEVGDTVTFTATVTRSDRDPKFGFFKRPTKAAIIG